MSSLGAPSTARMAPSECGDRKQHIVKLTKDGEEIRLFHIDFRVAPNVDERGVVLLIHGFPQTSYQYRHVLKPLSDAGYRSVVPDMRGHGTSSHPPQGYSKVTLADDLYRLLRYNLRIRGPIYVVGHDIGGMVAHAFATRYPNYVKALIWGECPLPGTSVFEDTKASRHQFHFNFQAQIDLAVQLVTGREKGYLKHFFDKLSYNADGIPPEALEHYTLMYSQPGALRAAFSVYEQFDNDAVDNVKWLERHGKCKIPTLGLNGEHSPHAHDMWSMLGEMYSKYSCEIVPDAGHYIAEENPTAFVNILLSFLIEHPVAHESR